MSTILSPRVALTIAGSDSSGGAGIQADLKTFADHGLHGVCAVTAVTAQNTAGVYRIDTVPVDGMLAQLNAVFADFSIHAIKIGMLGTAAHVRALAQFLSALPTLPPTVLDPVMVSSSGTTLLSPDAQAILRDELLPLMVVSTPNQAEAAILQALPHHPILITGGDLTGDTVTDTLFYHGEQHHWMHPRRHASRGFHGTGCTLSSSIAAQLALGEPLLAAVAAGISYVQHLLHASEGWTPGSGQHILPHALPPSPTTNRRTVLK